jgi:hypothetical protein
VYKTYKQGKLSEETKEEEKRTLPLEHRINAKSLPPAIERISSSCPTSEIPQFRSEIYMNHK